MKTRFHLLAALLMASVIVTVACAQNQKAPSTPPVKKYEGTYRGDIEVDDIRATRGALPAGLSDYLYRKDRDIERYIKVQLTAGPDGGVRMITDDGDFDFKVVHFRSEYDDGRREDTYYLLSDDAATAGKSFTFVSRDKRLELKATIVSAKLDKNYHNGNMYGSVNAKLEIPDREFECDFIVKCTGTFDGTSFDVDANLEISVDKTWF